MWFLAIWLFFTLVVESERFAQVSLSANMNRQREVWIRTAAARDLRMIDTQIIAGLQNGTAFFASTSLLAIGGCFALLNATDRVTEIFADLPLPLPFDRATWEVKIIGLTLIYAYAFFKFGWAYRLFNYCSILIGALPHRDRLGTEEMEAAIHRAARINVLAGQHFNRGLRAFFLSIGYLGWFLGGWALIVSSTLVLLVLLRRQFLSKASRTVRF
nr:DUF599 family protein [Methylobrevis pamukkalensis]